MIACHKYPPPELLCFTAAVRQERLTFALQIEDIPLTDKIHLPGSRQRLTRSLHVPCVPFAAGYLHPVVQVPGQNAGHIRFLTLLGHG